MRLVSAAEMRALDAQTIEAGTPGEILMERAGTGAFEEILEFMALLHPRHRQRLLICAGKGNNGGDGHVIARLCAERGEMPVHVHSVCPLTELAGDARLNAERLPETVVLSVGDRIPQDAFSHGTVVVDALLGTGIRGGLRPPFDDLVQQLNASGFPVVAIDIPSGVDSDTGTVADFAVHADMTVTMGLPKHGLIHGPGAKLSGRLRCVDIGIPAAFVQALGPGGEAVFSQDIAMRLGRLPRDAHKGMMGRLLVVGGSADYPGAPLLAGRGALRAGGGLVTVAYPAGIGSLIQPGCSALILLPLPDSGHGWHVAQVGERLYELLRPQHAVVLGPGLGRHADSLHLLRQILATEASVVLDADGLNGLCRIPDRLPRQGMTVLTPHPGEFQRLLRAYGRTDLRDAPRNRQASELAAALDAFVVLKGQGTVVAAPDGRLSVNSSGGPGLATAGSGDVLSGVLGAFLCQLPDDPFAALQLGVFVHGYAGELSPFGQRQLIADDLTGLIGAAMHRLSPFA